MSPFDFLNAINLTKENLIVDDETEKQYNAFMVNRGLSYFQDTALIANEMNLAPHLSSKPQFDFYIAIIRKRKRFSKWLKPEKVENAEIVATYFQCSVEKALQYLNLLDDEMLNVIKQKTSLGGRA